METRAAARCASVVALALSLGILFGPAPARAQGTYYVDTALDLEYAEEHCTAGEVCPLRSALRKAKELGGTMVTARICESAGDPGCLSTADRGYDAETGRWVLSIVPQLGAVAIENTGTVVDFASMVEGWADPGDNRFVVLGEVAGLSHGVTTDGNGNVIRGITIKGSFSVAAFEARVRAMDNRFEGLAVEGVEAPAAFRLRDGHTTRNVFAGNWCGLAPDGTLAPVTGDCLVVDEGATANVIGGARAPSNVFAAAGGVGVRVSDLGSDDNVIQSAQIGVDAAGAPAGPLEAGIVVDRDAKLANIFDNLIVGSRGSGIHISGVSFTNVITGNTVGVLELDGASHPNGGWGIELTGQAKGNRIADNTVAHNTAGGIRVAGGGTVNNQISRNRVYDNDGPEISVSAGANAGVQPPRISSVAPNRVNGSGCAGCIVEIYSGGPDGARYFEGTISVGVLSAFFFDDEDGIQGDYVSALQAQNENYSGLSNFVPVSGRVTPTSETPTSETPATPDPGETPNGPLEHSIWLPRCLSE